VRGLVEGFYGKPYSKLQRDILLRYISKMHEGTYMYAPKNDVFHRLRWRDEYPAELWNELTSGMTLARSLGVRFIFGISPWGFRSDEVSLLRKKALTAMGAGAAGVAVLFDDIPQQADASLARRQLQFVTEALDDISPPPLLCPSIYCSELLDILRGEEYLEAWRENSPSGWPVLWTGDMVVSSEIDRSDVETARSHLGALPVIWDNLLADDYCLRRIFLGDPSSRMIDGIDYLLNPSEIFPVALHAVHRMIASEGSSEWPVELGDAEAWTLLEGFHNVPWQAGDWVASLLEDMEKAVSDDPGSALLKRLDSMICVLGDFNENLGEMEGGFGLMPYSVDLRKFLWWWRKILELKEPGARMKELDRLVLRRLPYEHPIALMTCRILDNMTNGAADLEEGSNEG